MSVKIRKGALETMFDAFDTHGGHIIICLWLLLLGAVFVKLEIAQGQEIITFTLGVLARSMYGSGERQTARIEPTLVPPTSSPS